MRLDERGRQAADDLRARVVDDLPALEMLTSLQRTRGRRRLALAVPVAAAAVAVVAALTGSPVHEAGGPADHPRPSSPTSASVAGPTSPTHGNGVKFGAGDTYLRYPRGVYAPVLHDDSSPTWSPDGDRVAILDGGILITEAYTGVEHRLPCSGCSEIAWSPDGGSFAAVGVDGNPLGLVNAATGDVTPVPLKGVQAVRSVSWAPDGAHLAFLAVAPRSEQGGWTVRTDGSQQLQFLSMLTAFPTDQSGYSGAIGIRWSPTTASIAVLFATADEAGQHSPGGPFRLDVQTMHPDGATPNHLVYAGRCSCAGFTPNLVWSPDGTTLALFAQRFRPTESRLDGDGGAIQVEFLHGSGPLSWQPLPLVG